MNAWLGWGLPLAALAGGYVSYGWRGVVLALSVVVFWLLLQFSRALRVMKQAGEQPLGTTANAVMLASRLRAGQRLVDVIRLTHSLGHPRSEPGADPEVFEWLDTSGDAVRVELKAGRITQITLQRAAVDPAPPAQPGT